MIISYEFYFILLNTEIFIIIRWSNTRFDRLILARQTLKNNKKLKLAFVSLANFVDLSQINKKKVYQAYTDHCLDLVKELGSKNVRDLS